MAYREFSVPRGPVACTWEHRADRAGEQLVVPDACVDLIWLAGRELIVAGPDTRPHLEALPAGSVSTGVRLRPGAAGSFLGRPAHELLDGRIAASDLWRGWAARLVDDLAASSPRAARLHLLDAVGTRDVAVDPLVAHAARLLAAPRARVSGVAAGLGVTERQLHRRCRTAVGYGPKFVARVARLRALGETAGDPAERALAAGYASQAHMNEDVRRLTGLTAVRFLKDRGRTAA